MRKLAVYVHGKGGNATELEHYKPLLPEYDVIGFDYNIRNTVGCKTGIYKSVR